MNPNENYQSVREALLTQAIVALKQKLVTDPQNTTILERLAHLLRQEGELLQAANLFQQLLHLNPAHPTASYLIGLLTDTPTDELPLIESHPSPFIVMPNFLTEEQRSTLFTSAIQQQSFFEIATKQRFNKETGEIESNEDLTLRKQKTLHMNKGHQAMFTERIGQLLPMLFARLHIQPFSVKKISMNIAVTHNSGFSVAHLDDLDGHYKISYAYYFFKEPKAFTGGDFQLYDTNTTSDGAISERYTRIACRNNTIVFFPSNCFHQVTMVSSNSTAFDEGRFAVAGHLTPYSSLSI
ncbi:MAG: 2OG-Fe(II) oxygenase [Chloroflexota bacterium]